jgi:hypothetical protein
MFSEELEKLIEAAFVDGVLTDKEKAVIMKRAIAEGADPDEVEMILDAEVQKRTNTKKKTIKPINADANKVLKEFAETISRIEAKDFGGGLFDSFTNKSSIKRNREIANAIKTFPVPSSKEELLEFIPSMKSKWLHSDATEDDIKTAYKIKYKESLTKAKMLYGSEPDFQSLFNDENSFGNLFKLNRWSAPQRAALSLICFFMVMFFLCYYFLGDWSQKSVSTNGYETYEEAVNARDFESAQVILNKMYDNYNNKKIRSDFSSEDAQKKKALLEAYHVGVDYVFNAEALYLCSNGDEESLNRISYLLSDLRIEGNPIIEGTSYREYDLGENEKENHKKYVYSVTSFNSKCDKLIDLAITNNNYGVIERVYPLYKLVPDKIDSGSDIVIMNYSNIDKERAREKINKAIDSGTFPNVSEHI